MSQFLMKTIIYGCRSVRTSLSTRNLGFVRDPNVYLLRWISTSSHRQSFTVSYLENSLGFSSQSALSISRYVNFETPENADKVMKLFTDRGFTKTQMSRLVRGCPHVLLLNVEKIILPKLEFLESKGISGPEMANILSPFPRILGSSLANQIIPSYGFIWNLFQSDEKAIAAVKRFPEILRHRIDKYVAPNTYILREHGVPDSNIAKMMQYWPKSCMAAPQDFRNVVEKVVDMGFDVSKVTFVVAVNVFQSISKSKWENKVDEYKKWGFSEEEVLKAFKKYPWFMLVSKDKLIACMDFFVNQMGWRPCLLSKCPTIFGLSLKKRVVPRCSVFQVLLSKGLIEKTVSLNSLLKVSEKKFLQRFVAPYKEEAPELLKLYTEKLNLSKSLEIDDKVREVYFAERV